MARLSRKWSCGRQPYVRFAPNARVAGGHIGAFASERTRSNDASLGGEQLPAFEGGEDLHRGSRPVEGVEMQPRHAGLEQLRALRDAVLHAGRADRVIVRRLVDLRL